jgi:very-short-patch-repair endonuclease
MRMSPKIGVTNARALRRAMTLPEVLLWKVLRRGGGGYRFRRQHPAGPYVLDFFCPAAGLCIEVDGKAHDMGGNPARDSRRDAWLQEQGIRTLRIPAAEVLRDIEPVLRLIQEQCAERSPSTIRLRYASADGPPPLQKQGRN